MTAWIGLTGGIGSGKSQAAACFSALGVPVINADVVNREIIESTNHQALIQIKTALGNDVLNSSGSLNKAKIREIIFHNQKAKQKLESILHPHIIANIQYLQKHTPNTVYGIIEIPTLTEHPAFQTLIQRILLIHCIEPLRIQRVMQRNNWEESTVRAIIRNQATDEQRLLIAHDVINNSGSLKTLEAAVITQHQRYLQQFSL